MAGAEVVRDYVPEDEVPWLRCRALSFLDTDYFDDVVPAKPTYDADSIELVATMAEAVVGAIDVAVRGALATIETIAVHPDMVRRGVAGSLLSAALERLPRDVRTIDAWTRENPAANGWYVANRFQETYRYLHVYAREDGEVASAMAKHRTDLTPVAGFFHARIEDEGAIRNEFARVYICRRYERLIVPDELVPSDP